MGLDMYIYTTSTRQPATDFTPPADGTLLHTWRKHRRLHAWMERHYRHAGGMEEDFNLAPVVVDAEALERLAHDIACDQLPEPSLGYAGASHKQHDLSFIAKARAAIANGLTVYYLPSW